MFINTQAKKNVDYYEQMLKISGSLSRLFAESAEPYLGYRLVENLFCKSFNATNLSRFDTSIDASTDDVGVGIKTFIYRNGKSFEKIAEFNKELDLFKGLDIEEKVKKVSQLRNERVEFAQRAYKLKHMFYHCVTRDASRIVVYETPMETIDINNISGVKVNRNTIKFTDGKNQYGFNTSKSTLYKQFRAENVLMDFSVKIISDPFELLEKTLRDSMTRLIFSPVTLQPHVFLPLYSVNKKTNEKFVPEKSSLNQWNADGRPRHLNEVYIQIPAWVRNNYPEFFPNREVTFSLHLPNKEVLQAKVCQDQGKALMSDPNAKLGSWILREVMALQDGELLTYEKLESLGLDSVVIYKLDNQNYKIDFARIGSYDNFTQISDSTSAEEDN